MLALIALLAKRSSISALLTEKTVDEMAGGKV